jgi:hypothetical protein
VVEIVDIGLLLWPTRAKFVLTASNFILLDPSAGQVSLSSSFWTSVHRHTSKKMEDLLHALTFNNNVLLPPTCFIKHKPATTIIHWLDLCACRGLQTSSWCCCMIQSIVCDNCLQRELQHFLRHGMATMECSRMYGKITIAIAVLGVS